MGFFFTSSLILNTIDFVVFYKNMNKFLKIFSILILCKISFLHSASVHGKITDKKTDEPLSGANVFISVEGDLIGAVSDLDGDYQIDDAPEGNHNLEVTYVGYKNHFQIIEIGNKKKYKIDIDLERKALQSDEIIITEEMRKEKKMNLVGILHDSR